VVSLTSLQLHPLGKSPQYSLDGKLDEPRAGLDDLEKRKFLIIRILEEVGEHYIMRNFITCTLLQV
jgi:hypothetical protein